MKRVLQKTTAIAMVIASLSTVSTHAFAATNEVNKRNKATIESVQVYKEIPEITPEQFNKAIAKAIEKQVNLYYQETKNKAEAKLLRDYLESTFADTSVNGFITINSIQVGEEGGFLLQDYHNTWLPDIKIENEHVAAAINGFINATLIVLGVGSVSAEWLDSVDNVPNNKHFDVIW